MAGQAPAQPAPVAIQAPQIVVPVATTDKLRGTPPDTFKGDRKHSETFLRQFNLYWGLNESHEVMQVPYFRAMYALSLMRGPNIDDWVNDQVLLLRELTTRVQNPIDRNDPDLWNDFNTRFTNAYTDTAKKQTAQQKLMALKMYQDDLDTYISTFKNLCTQASYELPQKVQCTSSLKDLRKHSLKPSFIDREESLLL